MTITDVATDLTGERFVGNSTSGGDSPPSREAIARLAYQFYEARGEHDGRDVDDWLSAEQALTRHDRRR